MFRNIFSQSTSSVPTTLTASRQPASRQHPSAAPPPYDALTHALALANLQSPRAILPAGLMSLQPMATALQRGMTTAQISATLEVRGTITDSKQLEVEVPADISFLLDISGSMSNAPARAMDEQLQWLIFHSQLIHNNDFVQIAAFNSTTKLLMKPTRRENLTISAVTALNIPQLPNGGTQLWDAMSTVVEARKTYLAEKAAKQAIKQMVDGGHHRPKPRQKAFVMLVLTDGESSGSPEAITARLKNIGQEIPNFHMHILGVNLNPSTEAILQAVVSANPKRCEFTNVVSGHGAVADAIRDSFRTHFTKTITNVRHVMRSMTVGADGQVTVKERQLDPSSTYGPGHHGHAYGGPGQHTIATPAHFHVHEQARVAPSKGGSHLGQAYHVSGHRHQQAIQAHAHVDGHAHGAQHNAHVARPQWPQCRHGAGCQNNLYGTCKFRH